MSSTTSTSSTSSTTSTSTHISHSEIKLIAFYLVLAIVYFTGMPKWIGYVMLGLAIAYLLFIIMLLRLMDRALTDMTYDKTVSDKQKCDAQKTAELCGVWVDSNCYRGYVDADTKECKRFAIPKGVYWMLFGLLLLNCGLLYAFYCRPSKLAKKGKTSTRKSRRSY